MFFRFSRRLFNFRQVLLPAAIWTSLHVARASTKENELINQKLTKKINELHHHNKDLSKFINDDFKDNVVIFSGNSNKPLAQEIAQILGIQLGDIKVGRFADGEVSIEVKENVRSKNIYIVQSTCPPVN